MDIYFHLEYGRLYEEIENGVCEVFEYNSNLGKVHHMFIKREIPIRVENQMYYDLITPYGYGGPVIVECKEGTEEALVQEFNNVFKRYCYDENIVSEFVRFHPIVDNAKDFNTVYKTERIRKTVGTNVQGYDDPIAKEFSKSARKTIRRALRENLSFRVTEKPNDISSFKEVYYSTMDRNKASDYYYFDDNYFEQCLESFRNNIILVEVLLDERVIAAGFYFVYKDIIHAHLSGTLNEYLKYSPAYILKYATVLWAKENNVRVIHYGGGTTNEETDSLYQFKKKFGRNTEFDFYIGKKIWNKKAYGQLCVQHGINEGDTFFPAYRSNKIFEV